MMTTDRRSDNFCDGGHHFARSGATITSTTLAAGATSPSTNRASGCNGTLQSLVGGTRRLKEQRSQCLVGVARLERDIGTHQCVQGEAGCHGTVPTLHLDADLFSGGFQGLGGRRRKAGRDERLAGPNGSVFASCGTFDEVTCEAQSVCGRIRTGRVERGRVPSGAPPKRCA